MSEKNILICLIAFILGFLVSKMFSGNGFSIGVPLLNMEKYPGVARFINSLDSKI